MAAAEASATSASADAKQVMIIVGRMNPPTPGHIRGLCIPFLLKLKELAIAKLGLAKDQADDISLEILLKDANIIPRIYLTLTTNTKKIDKLGPVIKPSYNKIGAVKQLVENKDNVYKPGGVFYVKDPCLENPLVPYDKKWYVTTMLFNELTSNHKNLYLMTDDYLKEYLNNIVVCQTDGELSKCGIHIFEAAKCAKKLIDSSDDKNLHIFMGEEEVEDRRDICARFTCVPITRTIGSGGVKMSGSLIRLYVANMKYDEIYTEYEHLLTREEIAYLIKLIRIGLMMDGPDVVGASPLAASPGAPSLGAQERRAEREEEEEAEAERARGAAAEAEAEERPIKGSGTRKRYRRARTLRRKRRKSKRKRTTRRPYSRRRGQSNTY